MSPHIQPLLETNLCTIGTESNTTPWTIADAVEGTQIFGGTGSGKTSGSGRHLATALIKHGFGGLVLTAKSDEIQTWRRYLIDAGMNQEEVDRRVIRFRPGCGRKFNLLDYEFRLTDTTGTATGTKSLVNLFMTALGSGEGVSTNEPFWDDALRELLTHTVDLLCFANGVVTDRGEFKPSDFPIRLSDMLRLIQDSPQDLVEAKSTAWLHKPSNYCGHLLLQADERFSKLADKESDITRDLQDTVAFWLDRFPSLHERPRSVITSSFTGKATDLTRRPLGDLLSGETTKGDFDASPRVTFEGKILILDFPIKKYKEVGRFAQVLYKTIWQDAVESPTRWLNGKSFDPDKDCPVFLWVDEAQHFVTKEDALFQASARSQLAATVYLTQSLSNYQAVFGKHQSAVHSLLGSLQMKVFHPNGDVATNKYAEELFASDKGGYRVGESFEPIVLAKSFTTLPRPRETGAAHAYIIHPGKRWNVKSEQTANPINCYQATFNLSGTEHVL